MIKIFFQPTLLMIQKQESVQTLSLGNMLQNPTTSSSLLIWSTSAGERADVFILACDRLCIFV